MKNVETNTDVFIQTENIRKILNRVRSTISQNGWLAIAGEVGSGKTTICEHLQSNWLQHSEKYTVVFDKGWIAAAGTSAAGNVMKKLIRAIDPDAKSPGDLSLRANVLKTKLFQAARANRKVVLLIDEAQDLTPQTLRELKKIHETTGMGFQNLFSIIMVMKESHRTDSILESRELGWRISRVYTAPLTSHEIIEFAVNRYGVQFADKNVATYFTRKATASPLWVCRMANQLQELHGDKKITRQDIEYVMNHYARE
ncbi:MAG: AAA family ATPase, partial [Leptospiraceae bacterium]|nr:AAA family ATPase [Leptospiraceae bacterium]